MVGRAVDAPAQPVAPDEPLGMASSHALMDIVEGDRSLLWLAWNLAWNVAAAAAVLLDRRLGRQRRSRA